METIKVANPNATEFVHNEGDPSLRLPNLDAISKFMFDRLASVEKTKEMHGLETEMGVMWALQS